MIVKIQVSLSTTFPTPQVLVYNEDKSFMYTGGINEDMIETMQGRYKAYFEAEVVKGVIEIGEEVEAQDW